MNLHVIIASHLNLYRIITIIDCIQSISECVKYAELYMINCYISYSYEDFIYSKLEQLENILKSNKNLNIILYRHKQKKLQFEHIKYILEQNSFNDNDWIMFSDDDDISVQTRITTFFYCLNNYNFDVFRSNMLLIERDTIIKKPYTYFNLLKHQHLKNTLADFATTIVKIKILKEFFDFYKDFYKDEFDLVTDCIFSNFIENYKVYKSEEYLYIVRTRMYTSQEKFLELYSNENLTLQ